MYLISASSLRAAKRLAERNKVSEHEWTYVPWGNSVEREKVLCVYQRIGVAKKKMLGYFTDGEIFDLTGSF